MKIEADIFDIRSYQPVKTDLFFVDTNVWYWLTYSRASMRINNPQNYQTKYYPKFTSSALNNGAQIYQSGLSLAELTHLIERSEFEIFASANPLLFSCPKTFSKKFRYDYPVQRKQVISEIESIWAQISTLATPLSNLVDQKTCTDAVAALSTFYIDGYDLFIIDTMLKNNITSIITDDCDFASIKNIKMYTANNRVLQEALSQGKLLS